MRRIVHDPEIASRRFDESEDEIHLVPIGVRCSRRRGGGGIRSDVTDRVVQLEDCAAAFCSVAVFVLDEEVSMKDGREWSKGRGTKTAWEGAVMVGDDVRVSRRWGG